MTPAPCKPASGARPDQTPRQRGPNTGAPEQSAVDLLATRHDGFAYPAINAVIGVESFRWAQSAFRNDGCSGFS